MILENARKKLAPLAITLLRLSTGLIMALHGWQKLTDIAGTTQAFTNIGLPQPGVMVYLAIAGEFLGGLGLLVGFLTPIAALGIMSTMAVAILKVHLPNGLVGQGGFEYPLTLFLVALFFAVNGAGAFSVDALCGKHCCKKDSSEI
ncbi:MAG: DoxX family protein [Deltaproteobacteria bacterium]|nr:DoxX family protein [Deltaproteobacteria bacterium]